ncbi:MAG TPA: hypothetical protein VNI02_08015 [Blastocatellia bacterium]|jgi:hypothetical protein|nr:hypothetical protein [Blastocatellia bacterium]
MVDDSVILRGLSEDGSRLGPLILERTDQEFIPAILDELSREGGLRAINSAEAKTTEKDFRNESINVLKLFQPVHRTFNVVLLEVACDALGQPRLDPGRIESSGLVVRRVAAGENGQKQLQGWRQKDQSLRGWVKFNNEREQDQDPDPQRRPAALAAGNPEIDRRLARLVDTSATLAESVSPLFVAPPDVCKAAGRTILYGVIPLTSSELSERASSPPSFDDAESGAALRNHVSRFLRAGAARPMPRAEQVLDYTAALPAALAGEPDPQDNLAPNLKEFVGLLRQLAIEFDAFGEAEEARALFDGLNGIALPFRHFIPNPGGPSLPQVPATVYLPAGDFLKLATRALVELEGKREKTPLKITMPMFWPPISEAKGGEMLGFIKGALKARFASVVPREGRYQDLTRQYQVRAFVRVKRSDGCPPQIVWGRGYSAPFTIAPWYEAGAAAPVLVPLPDLMDPKVLKKLKPNAAFAVPKNLFNMLNANDPKKLADGEGKDSTNGFDLDWICGFSIPIITICAFIVLSIFLSLFDIIFRWMLFIKICIPIPRSK